MTFKNEEDRVLLYDEFAREVILDVLSAYTEEGKKTLKEFQDQFEIVGVEFPGNPKEDYYQGMDFTSVIKRKSDGRLFGFTYWKPIAKYSDYDLESNGYDFGFEDEDVYVFLPVREFSVQGYEVVQP